MPDEFMWALAGIIGWDVIKDYVNKAYMSFIDYI